MERRVILIQHGRGSWWDELNRGAKRPFQDDLQRGCGLQPKEPTGVGGQTGQNLFSTSDPFHSILRKRREIFQEFRSFLAEFLEFITQKDASLRPYTPFYAIFSLFLICYLLLLIYHYQ